MTVNRGNLQDGHATQPLLELFGIGKTYKVGDEESQVLSGISLRIDRGDFLAISGPSGAGKSTLLNVLGLLDTCTSGKYVIEGQDTSTLGERVKDRLRREMFGFVFQSANLIIDDTGAKNASLGLRIIGTPFGRREERIADVLTQFGLMGKANQLGKNFSGGERQRLALARAIATGPIVLLADEPTGNLDSGNTEVVIDYLRTLNRQGVTVIVITHDERVASAATTRAKILDGKLLGVERGNTAAPRSQAGSHVVCPTVDVMKPRWITGLVDDSADAVGSLAGRPLRGLLLMLAFVLGTGGLVFSTGLSQSAAIQVSERLTQASLDEVSVVLPATRTVLTPWDLAPIVDSVRSLPGVRKIGFRQDVGASDAHITLLPPGLFSNQPEFQGPTMIVDSEFLALEGARVHPAVAPKLLDLNVGEGVAILGSDAAKSLGVSSAGLGKKIWINGKPISVVGIAESDGRNAALKSSVMLSIRNQMGGSAQTLVIRTAPGYPAPLADAIPKVISPGNPGSIKVETVADLRALRFGVQSDLGSLVGVISLVLLILASLSSATAMYLSVQARSSDIALRRAIGASRASIRRLFVAEGLVVGAAGGIAGTAMGACAVLGICAAQSWTPVVSMSTLYVGIAAGAITGILSAVYPAMVAARADPATAIRG